MSIPRDKIRRILCLRLRSMGDAVLMTPTLRALRRSLPEAAIHVVLDRDLAPLFEKHPHVDCVHPLGRSALDKLSLVRRLRRTRFQAAINLHGGPTSALLTAATGARIRVGRDVYRFRFLYNRKAETPEIDDVSAIHTVHSQASLVTTLGIDVQDWSLHLEVPARARQEIARRLERLGVSRPGYVVLQPTASFPSKQWPEGRFSELVRALRRESGRELICSLPTLPRLGRRESRRWKGRLVDTSSPSLATLEERFSRELPVLSGLPVDELAALMEGALLYLGNDSGPMHVAAALGKPVVALFGSSDPKRWHPWGVPHRVIWAGLECSPCHGKWCANPERFACLERIQVDMVLKAAMELLEKKDNG